MRTKRSLLLVCLFLCLAVGVFANGQQQAGAAPASGGAAVQTLTMLMYADMTAPEGRTWTAVKAAFQAAYPNIAINDTTMFNEPYHQRLAAMAASNTLPDLMYLWPGGRTGEVTAAGKAADLTPRLGEVRSMYPAGALQAQDAAGHVFELPTAMTACGCMYVNNEILTQLNLTVPTTYDQLKAQVPAIHAAGKIPIIMANNTASNWMMESCVLSTVVGRIAGDTWFTHAEAGTAHFTDDVFVQSLAFIQQLYDDGVMDQSTLQMDYGALPGLFANNAAPYYINGDWGTGALVDPALFNPARQANVQMVPLPSIHG